MKAVLISIQPKWCEFIASGKKTVEVRKTKPKLETPFKVYIYCTKAKNILVDVIKDGDKCFGETYHGKTRFIKCEEGSVCDMYGKRQKVIGEFICDRFIPLAFENGIYSGIFSKGDYACMTVEQARKYGEGKTLYGWHISDLVIYDKPKELSEFIKIEKCPYAGLASCLKCKEHHCFTRPPQSWCYVERLGDVE